MGGTLSKTLEKVTAILSDSCGLKASDVDVNASMIQDLGVDSIDMMDILFGLEKEFKIKFSLAEIEDHVRKTTAPAAFETNHVISAEGLQALRKLMPEVSERLYPQGMIVQQIPLLFTVTTVAAWVDKKIADKVTPLSVQNSSEKRHELK